MLTAILTRTRPDLFVFFTEQMFESVKFLGLTAEDALPALSTDAYNTYRGIQTAIRDRMREMGIKAENGNDADYLTVNEFTWFVSENQDLIKEEVMKKQWKPVNSTAAKKSGTRTLSDAFANDEMLKRLAAALRTKPFAILAGHSGTGKSQLVRRLAYRTCNNDLLAKEGEGKTAPCNYCMVQVKPNWHDSSDLLGYYSEMGGRHFVNTPFVQFVCKAYAYPDTPFFVCLDEMNLAPVEQYFAEYLSAIESLEKKGADWVTDPLVEVDKDGETIDPEILGQIMKGAESTEAAEWIQAHGLTIPKNLFVIGTVNMDETTCQFSRKVLDRAMTLLMNTVSFADMATGRKPSDEELLDDDGVKFFLEGDVRGEVGPIESGLLDGINEPLKNTAFVVAYRFANEYALYEAAWAKLRGIDLATAAEEDKKQLASEALDQVVLMKLLPRIHGERAAVKAIFEGGKRDGKETPGLKDRLPAGGLSVGMMDDILARGDEYLTFWP
ncbi:MAG: AAA family ATPase [Kiritimatiellae bacterium]|nr:AAA family ATPase [Kiritimatiellia bacterium]